LSGRDAEVLGLLARGNPDKTSARYLGFPPKAVDNQVRSIYAKRGSLHPRRRYPVRDGAPLVAIG